MTEYLRISQIRGDEAIEIVSLRVAGEGTFKQIGHMPVLREGCTEGDVWIDQIDFHENTISEAPHKMSAYHGRWLLAEFFKMPSEADKIKKQHSNKEYNVPTTSNETNNDSLSMMDDSIPSRWR